MVSIKFPPLLVSVSSVESEASFVLSEVLSELLFSVVELSDVVSSFVVEVEASELDIGEVAVASSLEQAIKIKNAREPIALIKVITKIGKGNIIINISNNRLFHTLDLFNSVVRFIPDFIYTLPG